MTAHSVAVIDNYNSITKLIFYCPLSLAFCREIFVSKFFAFLSVFFALSFALLFSTFVAAVYFVETVVSLNYINAV